MSGEPHCGSCTVRIFLHFAPCTVRTPPPFCSICRNCCSLRIMYGKNRSRFAQFCGNKKSLFAPSAVSSMPDILSCSHSRACVRAGVCVRMCVPCVLVGVRVCACVRIRARLHWYFLPAVLGEANSPLARDRGRRWKRASSRSGWRTIGSSSLRALTTSTGCTAR